MKAAVWHDPRHGPALAALLPKGRDRQPETARIPYQLPPGPLARLNAKGEHTTWEQWAQHLAEALPYVGRWTVEDVPDGLDAHQVLGYVREQAQAAALGGSSKHEPAGT